MGGSPPKAPDPVKTAGAQSELNMGTAVANQVMGMTNQVTPYGSMTYNQTGTYNYTDPLTGKTTPLPQYTSTQTLSPAQQALQDQQTRAGTNTAKLAADQSQRLGSILGKPINLNGAPQVTAPKFQQVSGGPHLQTQIGNAGNITKTYGDAGGYEGARKDVQDALMARLNPSLEQDRSRLQSQLANQGLKQGTEAYSEGMAEFGRNSNDARYGAILNAGQEQSRLAGLDQSKAQFQNAAQQQQFGQNAAQAAFGNGANQQMYDNRMGAAGFNNAASQQDFSNQQGMRSNYMNEQYANRNQPINEIAALLGTGQVQQPQFSAAGSGGIANTDFAGLTQQNYANKMQGYSAKQQMLGGLFGGLGDMAGGYLMMPK